MVAVTVYLARHGQAEGVNALGDRARALTDEGRAHLLRLTAALKGEARVKRVVTSPFVRARQSAELWAAACGVPLTVEDGLASGASSGAHILALAATMEEGTLLVGHNPEMAEAVSSAAGRGMGFPPGTVAALEIDGKSARLLWTRV